LCHGAATLPAIGIRASGGLMRVLKFGDSSLKSQTFLEP
jgi:hypothetical protein